MLVFRKILRTYLMDDPKGYSGTLWRLLDGQNQLKILVFFRQRFLSYYSIKYRWFFTFVC